MTHALSSADADFLNALAAQLPPAARRDVTPAYLEEPRGVFHGQAAAVFAPGSAEEVSNIVRACAAARVPIVPWSGGTGLVGGQIMAGPVAPVLLSTERMSAIRRVSAEEGTLVAEAGAILADVQAAAEGVNRLFPLSLASQGSARIGGLLSTNAGGVGVLRYGNARDLCLGVEAVLPDGQILRGLKGLRKDNTGYDLRHLLIGAEGTLGIITAAVLKLVPRPVSEAAAFLAVPSPEAALSLLSRARERLGDVVSAFELLQRTGFSFLAETMPDVRQPFADAPEWSVLMDIGLSVEGAGEVLEGFLAEAMEHGLVTDGTIAQSAAQRDQFWQVRESIPEANKRIGAVASHDVSVPLGKIGPFIEAATRAIGALGPFRINCFGHVGDGNLHFNIFPPAGETREAYRDRRAELSEVIHAEADALGGSFSAEHGVGRLKVATLEKYGDPAKLWAMRAIKAALDPAGIMNPGAVLRA